MKTMTFADLYLKLHDENGFGGFDIESLPTLVKAANQLKLTAAFKKHLELTVEQLDRSVGDSVKGPGRMACERVVARKDDGDEAPTTETNV